MTLSLSPQLEILWEDNSCLVLNKPGGLLTQAPLGIDSLEFRLKQLLRERDPREGKFYVGVPHRLDRPVSGVIVFARNVRAARRISEQFEARTVEKTYWGLVAGTPQSPEGTWTDYLRKLEGESRTEVVNQSHSEGRIAILHYRHLQAIQPAEKRDSLPAQTFSLLEIKLETGRTHQIRAQAGFHGHPLVGDALYGSACDFGPATADERQRLIGLHARSLSFRHPVSKEMLSFTAPLPNYWEGWGAVSGG